MMHAINIVGWLIVMAVFSGAYRLHGTSWEMAVKYAGLTLAGLGAASIGLHLAFLP